MLRRVLCLFVLSLQAAAALGRVEAVAVSASKAPSDTAQRMKRAIASRVNVKQWMHAVSTSKNAFDCSENSLKQWTDRCESLTESSHARAEMAAALTICEIKSVAAMNCPKECLDWIDTAGSAGPCIECAELLSLRAPRLMIPSQSIL